ncbi:MAG: N-acetyltransferase [Ruminococcaceae bacterium]|nr:N-acetyltransferase [Oscillospiraceae bacterium]
MIIESVKLTDADEILSIYAPYIEKTTYTFETKVPGKEEFRKRIEEISSVYPYYVCRDNGRIVGYAYASRYRVRDAYKYSVECSVYVADDVHRHGVGTLLYEALFSELKKRGYHAAIAAVTFPNEDSIAFHESFGFEKVGHLKEVGYKFDRWIDLVWLEKIL